MKLLNARVLDLATGGLADPRDLQLAGNPEVDEEVVDAEGRIAIPGLWDQHVHMDLWALHSSRFDVSGATSAAHCARLAGQALAGAPRDGQLRVGRGFRDTAWPDSPTAALLDEHTVGHAVVLLSSDLHAVWLNTAALLRLGLDPGRGHRVEAEAFAVEEAVGHGEPARTEQWVADCVAAANALGVVGITDMEQAWNPGRWTERVAAGMDALRVRTAVYPADLKRALDEGLRTGDVLDERGLVRMGPLKVIGDGSLTARTALCSHPYPDGRGHGRANVGADELAGLMRLARDGGLECAIHAIGDRANTVTLDAFEATGARGSIEHAQLVTAADVARMARLGVVASVQPSHLSDDVGAMDRLWGERAARAFPLADMLAAGVQLALGSDAPVCPVQPWQAMQDAVTRNAQGRAWHPEQRITLSQAMLASTNRVARVADGHPDVVLLECNPFELAADRLAGVRAWLTVVDGRVVHRSE